MKTNWKKIGAGLCTGFLLCTLFAVPAAAFASTPGASMGAGGAAATEAAWAFLDDEAHLRDGFTSHLPMVVIEQAGQASLFAERKVLSAGLLAEGSALKSDYTVQWSGEAAKSRPARDKADHRLSFSGQALDAWSGALWDSPVQDGWYLLGGLYDKSLMRNYLALSLAEELNISAYRVHYCEVFAETDGGYEYRGVYLLAAPQPAEGWRVQRGSYWDTDSTPLNSYAARQGFLSEDLYIPSVDGLDAGALQTLQQGVDAAEKVIYSYDYNEFSMYEEHLDLTKMYDYFILYEMFGNYSAAYLPQYRYSAQSDMLWPVALADFEYSLDNEQDRPMDMQDIEMNHTPYYEPLTKSVLFVDGLLQRYRFLAQNNLKSDRISTRIDETVALLGAAQQRDWRRWSEVYNSADMYSLDPLPATGGELPDQNRNTFSYEQEIVKLRFTLREHGNAMFGGISELYQQKNMVGNDARYVINTWFLVAFLAVIIASVRFVRYRTRGA